MEEYHYHAAIFYPMQFEGGCYMRQGTQYILLIIEPWAYSIHSLHKHTKCDFFTTAVNCHIKEDNNLQRV